MRGSRGEPLKAVRLASELVSPHPHSLVDYGVRDVDADVACSRITDEQGA